MMKRRPHSSSSSQNLRFMSNAKGKFELRTMRRTAARSCSPWSMVPAITSGQSDLNM